MAEPVPGHAAKAPEPGRGRWDRRGPRGSWRCRCQNGGWRDVEGDERLSGRPRPHVACGLQVVPQRLLEQVGVVIRQGLGGGGGRQCGVGGEGKDKRGCVCTTAVLENGAWCGQRQARLRPYYSRLTNGGRLRAMTCYIRLYYSRLTLASRPGAATVARKSSISITSKPRPAVMRLQGGIKTTLWQPYVTAEALLKLHEGTRLTRHATRLPAKAPT